jgi:tripartite-type tricarboxylate transporter receptor subunit TctC
MKRRQLLAASVGAAVFAPALRAETYPSRAITLISPFPAGGGGDASARAIADQMRNVLRVPVVVENVAGAGGTIGTMKTVRAPADGYTILMHNNGIATAAALYPQLKLDVQRDLAPVGIATSGAMILIGRTNRAEKSAKEVFDLIRRDGEKVNFGTAGPGTISHLCALLLMDKLKTKFTLVPYKGTAPALTDVMSGQIDFTIDLLPAAQFQGGRIVPYAVTTTKRTKALPDVETFAEAGVPGYRVELWQGLFAPKGTPADRIDVLSRALTTSLQDRKLAQSFLDRGVEIAPPERSAARGHAAVLQEDIATWAPIIQRAGIKLD